MAGPGLSPGLEAGARISTVFASHLRRCAAPVGPASADMNFSYTGGIELGHTTAQSKARRKKSPPARHRRGGAGGSRGVSLHSPLLPFPLPRDALFLVVILVVFLGVVPFRSRE